MMWLMVESMGLWCTGVDDGGVGDGGVGELGSIIGAVTISMAITNNITSYHDKLPRVTTTFTTSTIVVIVIIVVVSLNQLMIM